MNRSYFLPVLLLCALIRPLSAEPENDSDQQTPAVRANPAVKERFQWKPALLQSGLLLIVQHSSRMAQPKTRNELHGKFFDEWFESVSNIHTWNDSDAILTNYFGHPWMGAMVGYIQVQNDPAGRNLEFNLSSKQYWKSRLKAMAWSAAYSTQFELGPFGEASIGNVGKRRPTMGVVDLAVTPVGGFVWMLLEDFVDKRYLAHWEQGSSTKKARFYRVAFNPGRSIANLLRLKRPSYRDTRPL